jgi:hypothetical protein
LWRVGGIFTAVSISPSTSWRQWPSDYAIHARRNLPDKELRYLRLAENPVARVIGLYLESVRTYVGSTDGIAT